ncbi:hypothetical protein ACFFSH_16175 [Streptomyces filamentosus]|uniref:Uncharacterized protein n=1 Tax=Streptomyces filamentosus TaxID=67294 RepID=A0A919EKR7_STRFL|nr:hypothetical protein [Streptomyces filamentosus]GHF90515.1 hypothetical protein GCM10017667_19550 [Streptomyces filamentosus]
MTTAPAALRGLAANPSLPSDLLPALLARTRRAARHPGLPRPLMESVLHEADGRTGIELARNPALHDDFRPRLATHPDPWVRAAPVDFSGRDNRAGGPVRPGRRSPIRRRR